METASLRIKFTPLLNNALKNGSKCCLEIVPEVSCVQNLDKISWKQEKNLIEYTIPMTYKITLKKRESLEKEYSDLAVDVLELDKTYHSCVDLLPPTSSTFDFASGDITRIISDTYILGKISAKFEDHKSVLNNPANVIQTHENKLKSNECPKELSDLKHMEPRQTILADDNKASYKNDNEFPKPIMSDSYKQCLADKYSLNKITSTDNASTVCKVTETESNETSTVISTRSRDDSKRKLSLSPICSINTNDNPYPDFVEKVPLNLVVDRLFQYETRDISENVAFKLPTRNKKQLHIKTLNDGNKESEESFYEAHKRDLPEERVAKFIKKMEYEIMPLKNMLNDILQKCSTLGLSKNKSIPRNLILYKTIPNCKNQVEKYCRTERQTKSNRVVYSIVFDG